MAWNLGVGVLEVYKMSIKLFITLVLVLGIVAFCKFLGLNMQGTTLCFVVSIWCLNIWTDK
jgi:hypothetical protein